MSKKFKIRKTNDIVKGYTFTDYLVEAESYEEAINIIENDDDDDKSDKILYVDYEEYIKDTEFVGYSLEETIE